MTFLWGKRGRGQSFVEFALVLPVLLMTVLVIIELGRVFFTWLVLEQSARAGVRFAVTLEYDPDNCSSGSNGGACSERSDEKEARLHSIKDVVRNSVSVLLFDEDIPFEQPHFLKTTVCVSPRKEGDPHRYQPPNPGVAFDPADCMNGDDPGGPGDFVSVTVDYNHPVIVPFYREMLPLIRLHVRREARAETYRSNVPVFLATIPPVYSYPDTSTPTSDQTPVTQPVYPTVSVEPVSGTGTPTPDCGLLTIQNAYRDDNEVHFIVRNDNHDFPFLSRSVLTWPDGECEDLFHVTRMYFPYYSFHEYVYMNDTVYTSPVDSGMIHLYWPVDARPATDWAVRFIVDDDQPVFGTFQTDLTFEFPMWGNCLVSGSVDLPRITNTPTETPVAGVSATPSPTHTPGGPTETRRVTRTMVPTETPDEDPWVTASVTATRSATETPTPTHSSTPDDGPGD